MLSLDFVCVSWHDFEAHGPSRIVFPRLGFFPVYLFEAPLESVGVVGGQVVTDASGRADAA